MKRIFTLVFSILLQVFVFAQSGIDWAGNQTPGVGPHTTTSSSPSITVSIEAYKSSVTEPAGQGANITCQFAWSAVTNFGDSWGTINSVALTYTNDVSNNDLYSGAFTPPAIGKYEGKCRCQVNGSPDWYWANGANNIKVDATSVLGIELNSFKVSKNNKGLLLSWTTQAEKDNSIINIERSVNSTNYSAIGQIMAKGNNNETQNYFFIDENPVEGINYYRLQMVDNDGKITYSKVVAVGNDGKNTLSVYPNPVKSELNLVTDGNTEGGIIYDMTGRAIRQITDNQPKVDVQNLPNGVYFVRLLGKNGVLTEPIRFVKQ